MDFHMVILELLQPCSLQSGFFLGIEGGALGGRRMQVYQQSSATGNYDRFVCAVDWCYYNMVCVLRSCPWQKSLVSLHIRCMTRHWQLENYMLSLHYLLVRSWRVWLQQMAALTMQAELGFAMSRDGLIPPIFAKTHPKYKTPYRATVFLLPISMAFCIYRNVGSGCYIFYIFSVDGICADSDHDVPVPENVSPWND